VLHWFPLIDQSEVTMDSVGPLNALAHIIRCQEEQIAIAALDSATYQRIVSEAGLDKLFASLPAKYRRYRRRVDARCMSGIETIVRLMILDAGLNCEPQVFIPSIGFVDFVVEGRVVVETDGRLGHADAPGTARDYDRDVALAALNYIVLRFNYRQVMSSPEVVLRAVRGALVVAQTGPDQRR
jgi:very-short-patch-repair endonuclease